MRNFQDTFEICKRSFISDFSICMTVPLKIALAIQSRKEKNVLETLILVRYRSSHHRCSMKKGVPRNFTKLTHTFHRKTPVKESNCQTFFNKVGTLLKKRLWHRCTGVFL